ncbi:MAG: hypothetical protein AAGB48_04285 [Planctomycetota bacterium]
MPPERADTHARAAILLAILAVAVVSLTLFPFRFVETWHEYASGLKGLFHEPIDRESPLHALPAFAMLLLAGAAWPARRTLMLAAAIAIGLLLLEAAQAGLDRRHARVADIAAQWSGLAAAAVLLRFSPLRAEPARLLALLSLTTLLGWTALTAALGVRAQIGHTLGPFDDAFQLAIGDEVGGGRPWRGTVHGVAITTASPGDETARKLSATAIDAQGIALRLGLGDAAIYDLAAGAASINGEVIAPDRGTIGEPLFGDDATLNAAGLDTSVGGPLVSRDTLWRLPEALMHAQAVVIEADITPDESEQAGPARIMTVSSGPSARHLMLGQEGDALVVRVRTRRTGDNASRTPVRFPGVLEAGRRTHLVIVSTGDRFRLYADGRPVAERILGVGPGDWLGAHTAARDLIASAVFFIPIGLAAAAVGRHPVATALLAGTASVASPAATAIALGRPIMPAVLIMAPALALLAAITAQHVADAFKPQPRIADPDPKNDAT